LGIIPPLLSFLVVRAPKSVSSSRRLVPKPSPVDDPTAVLLVREARRRRVDLASRVARASSSRGAVGAAARTETRAAPLRVIGALPSTSARARAPAARLILSSSSCASCRDADSSAPFPERSRRHFSEAGCLCQQRESSAPLTALPSLALPASSPLFLQRGRLLRQRSN
jgi:hypothetical protein